jgi:alkylhydroperoxidase family enzyme
MSRVSPIARAQVTGSAREVLDRKVAELGQVPGMYGVFAHRPWILTTMDAHFSAVMGSGTVPLKLKEMLALQASLAHAGEQGARGPDTLALRTGATRERIAALLDFESGPWTDAEKAALRYGRRVTRDASVSDEVFEDLRRHFDDGEIVEITCVLALFTYFNRFKEALRVGPETAEKEMPAP